jgi:hypothetical protein
MGCFATAGKLEALRWASARCCDLAIFTDLFETSVS